MSKEKTKDSSEKDYSERHYGYIVKREVAARVRMTERTVQRWMKLGILPFLKIGKGKRATVLFKWPDVEAALQAKFGVGGGEVRPPSTNRFMNTPPVPPVTTIQPDLRADLQAQAEFVQDSQRMFESAPPQLRWKCQQETKGVASQQLTNASECTSANC